MAERPEEMYERRVDEETKAILARIENRAGSDTQAIALLAGELGATRVDIADLGEEVEALTSGVPESQVIDKLMGAFCDPGHVLKRRGLRKGEEPEPLYSWQRRAVAEVTADLGLVVRPEQS